ncbi:MAG: ATP synthase F1 subunit gamma [Flavobacteriales bacterium]|nr:ATP synthase F1 subunit gamma [Flavobacteriales bacterium]
MPNLKEIRNRITSIGSTMQITSAMKMVSAAKLKKAQDAITQMRPYSIKMQELMQNISSTLEGEDAGGNLTKTGKSNKVLYVVFSSNRGLCGGFNSSIIKEVKNQKSKNQKEVCILSVGKKAGDILKKTNEVYSNNDSIWDDISFSNASNVVNKIIKSFLNNEFSEVYLVYNQFKNAATQIVQTERFLPIELPKGEKLNSDYLFEPSKKEIMEDLIPKSLRTQFFKAVLESYASEHGARMTAMHKATDNANELRNDLLITYNKARQASITKEILEIVGGAEALGS